MSLFKQPWILVFVGLLGIYTYQVLNKAGDLRIQSSVSANASVKKDGASGQPTLAVDVRKFMASGNVRSLSVLGFESMDVSVVRGTGDQVEFQLLGEGSRYIQDGKKFEHWLKTTTQGAGNVVLTPSLSKSNKVLKLDFWANSDDLQLRVMVPPTYTGFENFTVKTVSGEVFVGPISAKKIEVAVVSGDLKLGAGKTDHLSVQSVSGDILGEEFAANRANIKSVSGDVRLMSESTRPSFNVKTVSGDLALVLSQAPNVKVLFKSVSGELKNQLEGSGQSLGRIQFSSLSGDAEISKIR